MQVAMPQHAPIRVSSTDWFKILGIAAFLIDHAGLFFFPDDDVWRVFGRVAAPIFFFFLGFAHSRSFPVSWLVWGVLLTGMEWWIEGDLTLNILLNFLFIRVALRAVDRIAQTPFRLGVVAAVSLACLPFVDAIFEYGAEGWLWALFGYAQRAWRDERLAFASARYFFAFLAAFTYALVEIGHHGFEGIDAAILALLIAILTWSLLGFQRTISVFQPPSFLALPIKRAAQYSLEIYAVSLFLMQDLAYVFQ